MNLDALLNGAVDPATKGWPVAHALPLRVVGEQGWNLLRGDLPLPAADTAAAIAARLGLAARTESDLREYDLGAWEGRSYAELMREHRLFERMQGEPDWQPGGGESARQVAARLAGRLEAIAAAHPGERVIVVSHGGALTLALGWLIDRELSAWRRVMKNCAISDLAMSPAPNLLCWNEVIHLEGLP